MMYLLATLMLIGTAMAQTNQTNQTATTQPNVTIDEHGCITSAGFVYCALREKCIRPWEEQCNDGRAVPLNATTTTLTPTTLTVIVTNKTNVTTESSPASSTSSSETTLASPPTTVQPILISTPVNATNVTNQNTTETTSTTTITEAPTTTEPPTTTTIAAICGNLYQEPGEECDTTASACGAGRWQCINCKCVPLPPETTTAAKSIGIPSNIDAKYVIGAFIAIVIVIVALVYLAGGKDEKEEVKKP